MAVERCTSVRQRAGEMLDAKQEFDNSDAVRAKEVHSKHRHSIHYLQKQGVERGHDEIRDRHEMRGGVHI